MRAEATKLTDSLERQLGENEIEAQRGAASAAGPGVHPLRRLIRLAGRLGEAMEYLRTQARRAKVDYLAG